MANKKISQLSSIDGAIGISTSNLLPIASGSAGNYVTAKVDMEQIQDFILSPMNTSSNQDIGFTGSENVVFKKTNTDGSNSSWDNASTNVQNNPYLQVRISDGQLITGSGVAVPAALGDDLGDHTATEPLNLAGYDVINTNEIYFGGGNTVSTRIEYDLPDPSKKNLKIQAEDDLTLSGIRHVKISGQALDLVNTPISGDVTFMKGGLTIPDNQGLTGDNIVINKTSRHLPHNNSASLAVDWANSNIQRDTRANATAPNYIFTNALAGQTLTMYVENNHNATVIPSFTSGSTVKWGGPTGGPPHLVAAKTNVYTFVCYDGVIFASAITGYAY